MAVGFERARDQLIIYFDLPDWPTRIKVGMGERYTEERRAQYERKNNLRDQIRSWIGAASWQKLLDRFPGSQPLRVALEHKLVGTTLTMDAMLDRLIAYWELGTAGKNRRPRTTQNIAKDVIRLNIVRKHFNKGEYAVDVDCLRLERFKMEMLKQGYSAGYINRCLAHIRTAFNKIGRLHKLTAPVFDTLMLGEAPPREDFFQRFEVDRLNCELPRHAQVATMVGYFTGWRLEEVLSRRIADVTDSKGEFLFLDAEHSKNGEERWFPLGIYPELMRLLEEQISWVADLSIKSGKVIEWLFPNPRTGDRMKGFYAAWRSAVSKAGLTVNPATGKRWVHSVTGEEVERLFHGFRRTATRNLLDLGLSEAEVMALVGHKTRSMHDRYKGMTDKSKARGIATRALRLQGRLEPPSPPSELVEMAQKYQADTGTFPAPLVGQDEREENPQ